MIEEVRRRVNVDVYFPGSFPAVPEAQLGGLFLQLFPCPYMVAPALFFLRTHGASPSLSDFLYSCPHHGRYPHWSYLSVSTIFSQHIG